MRNRLLQHLGAPDVESCFLALREAASPAVLEVGDGRRLERSEGSTCPLSVECQKAVAYFNDLVKACHQLENALVTAVHSNEQELRAYDRLCDQQSERAYSHLKRLQQELARWTESTKAILDAVDTHKAELSRPRTEIT